MLTNSSDHQIFRMLRYVHAFLGSAVVFFLIFIVVNAFVITMFTVDGHSMDPTLHNGQHLPVSLITLVFHPPRKDEIVILYYAGDPKIHFVKRVIGVPGDTVQFQGAPLVLGADQYFVAGDNRDHSTDSRTYGPVKRAQILGVVL